MKRAFILLLSVFFLSVTGCSAPEPVLVLKGASGGEIIAMALKGGGTARSGTVYTDAPDETVFTATLSAGENELTEVCSSENGEIAYFFDPGDLPAGFYELRLRVALDGSQPDAAVAAYGEKGELLDPEYSFVENDITCVECSFTVSHPDFYTAGDVLFEALKQTAPTAMTYGYVNGFVLTVSDDYYSLSETQKSAQLNECETFLRTLLKESGYVGENWRIQGESGYILREKVDAE